MLLFNKKISAAEACKLGLVTEVFPDQSFQTEVWERINSYAKFPKGVSLVRVLLGSVSSNIQFSLKYCRVILSSVSSIVE